MAQKNPLQWFLVAVLLSSMACVRVYAGTVTGQIQLASSGRGVPNGTFTFTLTQAAVVSGTASVVTSGVNCYTDALGNIVGLPNPLAAPVLSPNYGSGSLPAGNYFVRTTWANSSGETVASPERNVTTTQTGTLVVQLPINPPANATQWKIYISTASGSETLQSMQNAPFSNYSQSTALVAGASLPPANTSVCSLRFNDELQPSYTGYNVTLTTSSGATVTGFPQRWYLSGGSLGTINVGAGLPLYNGVVVYPQPIISNPAQNSLQSINGPLNMNGYPILNTATSLSASGLTLPGSTSGFTTLQAQPVASGTVTLPNGGNLITDTTTNTLTNKTLDTAGSNTIKINGNTLSAASGAATVTIPNSTDTLVGRATTDTLVNKTLSAPFFTGTPIFSAANSLQVGNSTTTGSILFSLGLGGLTILSPSNSGSSGTWTLPATTDTFVGRATTDTLTNKSFDTAGTGNSLAINGSVVSAVTGGGAVVLANSPSLTTPTVGSGGLNLIGSTSGTATLKGPAVGGGTLTLPPGTDTIVSLNANQILSGKSVSGGLQFAGATTGVTLLQPQATATGTLTLPSATDTLVGRATTDTLSNKTLASPAISGTITSYNNISTVGNGVGAIYARTNLTGQTSSIGTTTLYSVPSSGAGLYSISIAYVTTTAGTAGTVSLTLNWNNGSIPRSITFANVDLSVTGADFSGRQTIYSGVNQNITFSTTDSGSTGQYRLVILVEYLGT
jgi:hypothetical protein